MLALTLEAAKNSAILIIAALVVVALVVARFVASVAFTAVTLLIVGATCTFFGSQITVPATASSPSQPAG